LDDRIRQRADQQLLTLRQTRRRAAFLRQPCRLIGPVQEPSCGTRIHRVSVMALSLAPLRRGSCSAGLHAGEFARRPPRRAEASVLIFWILNCPNLPERRLPSTVDASAYPWAADVTHKRAEEYRRLAQECLIAARTVSTAPARSTLIKMAQVWERLADEQEKADPERSRIASDVNYSMYA
jgi:hypothetical protein